MIDPKEIIEGTSPAKMDNISFKFLRKIKECYNAEQEKEKTNEQVNN